MMRKKGHRVNPQTEGLRGGYPGVRVFLAIYFTFIGVLKMEIQRVKLPDDPIATECPDVSRAVDGLRDLGFILVEAPELEATTRAVYAVGAEFFALPDSKKREYYRPETNAERGFSPRRDETGLLCKALGPGGERLSDEKEFFAVGHEPSDMVNKQLLADWKEFYHSNSYPPLLLFQETMEAQRRALMKIGAKVLRAIEANYGMRPGRFDEWLQDGASMMRLINYPSLTKEEIEQKSVWGCSHRDLSFVTVLSRGAFMGSGIDDLNAGLWIKPNGVDHDDKANWVRASAPEGFAFVQVGDLLEIYSKGTFKSAYHEIRAPRVVGGRSRMSTSVFMHIRPDIIVNNESGLMAGTYVREELQKIGLALAA